MKIKLGYFGLYCSIAAFSLILTGAAFALSPLPLDTALTCILRNPLVALLNWLPVLLFTLLAAALFNRLWPAFVFSSVAVVSLTLVNRFKTLVRQEPFLPSDFRLIREAAAVADAAKTEIGWKLVVLSIGMIVLAALSFFIRTPKTRPIPRLSVAAGAVLAVLLLNRFVYSDRDLYFSFYNHGSNSKLVDIVNSRGFLYSFWYHINGMRVVKPEGYSDARAQDILARYGAPSEHNAPEHNVIFILQESFTELSDDPLFIFEDDPLAQFKEIEGFRGTLAAPGFGGSTANTEFDILTGLCSAFINDSPSAYWYIRKEHGGVTSAFKERGYDAAALHPGFDWFYNRANVYRHFGFDTFIHRGDFDPSVDSKGGLISDEAAYRSLREIVARQPDGRPLFAFVVTIQNHTPYANRFVRDADIFSQSRPLLDPEEKDALSNYFIGVADGCRELKGLTEFLDGRAEPYLLVFYGDHLPSFGAANRIYDELGYDEGRKHETPFIIWQNAASEAVFDLGGELAALGLRQGQTLGANFLGALVLELLGLDGGQPFMQYVNDIRKETPDLRELDPEETLDYRIAQYYCLTR